MTSLVISILFSVLLIISILFFPKIKVKNTKIDSYWVVTLFFAVLLIILGEISFSNIKELLFNDNSINPIKIIILFLSMTLLSIFLDQVGLFKYLANLATKKFNKNQRLLFIALFILISILTVFTSNDVIILTFTPFICYFCKRASINPLPYLLGEFFAANTLSMSLIIGNPTNIYIASIMDIDFMEYFNHMFILGLLAAFVLFVILLIVFNKEFKKPMVVTLEEEKIKSRFLLVAGVMHLAGATILMAVSNYIHFEMYLVALLFAMSLTAIVTIYLLIRRRSLKIVGETYSKLPFAFIPFLISMVIIIGSLKYNGILEILADILSKSNSLFVYQVSSFILGNLVNNIPMSILYSELLSINSSIITAEYAYAVIASSNLCALFTPLGSLAGMMFLGLVNNQGINLNFKKFVKYGYISIILICLSFIFISL